MVDTTKKVAYNKTIGDTKRRANVGKGKGEMKNQLKKIREQEGYTQEEVANKLDISVRQYQRLEATTPKSVEQFDTLAKLFNTTIDTLLEQDV